MRLSSKTYVTRGVLIQVDNVLLLLKKRKNYIRFDIVFSIRLMEVTVDAL